MPALRKACSPRGPRSASGAAMLRTQPLGTQDREVRQFGTPSARTKPRYHSITVYSALDATIAVPRRIRHIRSLSGCRAESPESPPRREGGAPAESEHCRLAQASVWERSISARPRPAEVRPTPPDPILRRALGLPPGEQSGGAPGQIGMAAHERVQGSHEIGVRDGLVENARSASFEGRKEELVHVVHREHQDLRF